MPSTGVINGTNLRIKIGTDPLAYATSCALDLSAETLESVSKDSVASWSSSTVGQLSGSLSFEGFYTEDATISSDDRENPNTLFDAFAAKTLISWEFSTATSGDTKYTGSGYITALNFTGPVEENATYSGTITVSGAVTQGSVT